MTGTNLTKYRDEGLFILRLGLGICFMIHGIPKLAGGPHFWTGLGHAMGFLGITVAPTFWGFMAAIVESAGGLLLALGLLFRPVCVLLVLDMIVALAYHLHHGDAFPTFSHPIEVGIVFLSLILIGPGKYSFDRK